MSQTVNNVVAGVFGVLMGGVIIAGIYQVLSHGNASIGLANAIGSNTNNFYKTLMG